MHNRHDAPPPAPPLGGGQLDDVTTGAGREGGSRRYVDKLNTKEITKKNLEYKKGDKVLLVQVCELMKQAILNCTSSWDLLTC